MSEGSRVSDPRAASPELIPGGVPLENVPILHAAQVASLHGLWINTAQQLVGIYGTTEPTRVRLAGLLQVPHTALDGIVNTAQRLIPLVRSSLGMDFALQAATNDYPLGAFLEDPAATVDRMAGLRRYGGSVRGPLPACFSLLGQLPPLRSQGRRSTCVAHATLAVREQLEIGAGAPQDLDLSEEYVHWWCKQRDGLIGRYGTYLSVGMRCLDEAGAPFESLWPYVPDPTGDSGEASPPAGAVEGDLGFATEETQEFNRADVEGMKACLAEGRSIAFSFPVFDSWFKSSAMARWGIITMPLPGEPPRDGHAVALVGYQDDQKAPGGGYFLVRNSWQPWAWDGVVQPGYGCVPYDYVARLASTVFSARRGAEGRAFISGDAAEGASGLIVNSPDVWLRQAPDGGEQAQSAVAGQENALYLRMHNPGSHYLYQVGGEAYFQRRGSELWECAGRFDEAYLRPGTTVVGPLPWLPPLTDSFAFAVRLS